MLFLFCYLFKKILIVNDKVTYRNILSSHNLISSTMYMLKFFPNKLLTMLRNTRAFPMLWQHLHVLRKLLQWNNYSEWQLGLQCVRKLLKKHKTNKSHFKRPIISSQFLGLLCWVIIFPLCDFIPCFLVWITFQVKPPVVRCLFPSFHTSWSFFLSLFWRSLWSSLSALARVSSSPMLWFFCSERARAASAICNLCDITTSSFNLRNVLNIIL